MNFDQPGIENYLIWIFGGEKRLEMENLMKVVLSIKGFNLNYLIFQRRVKFCPSVQTKV